MVVVSMVMVGDGGEIELLLLLLLLLAAVNLIRC
jgi:hypothetical protein